MKSSNTAAKAAPRKGRFKKGDRVMVIAGKAKGQAGEVLRVDLKRQVVYVKEINLHKRHSKPRFQGDAGGIIPMEGPIHLSNVLVECGTCGKGVRHLCQDVNTCKYNRKN
ncbi:MAG TPA: 50S ribosomal protein L24 [bacterium]|nr:50S ribosomal protein L24 [bacterium]